MYYLHFVLHTYQSTAQQIQSALAEFGSSIEVIEQDSGGMRGNHFRISLAAEDPTMIFDACAHFGRIKSVRIEETSNQRPAQ